MISKFKDDARVVELCKWANVPLSSFHYKSHPGPRGMKPSAYTLIGDGCVSNELVVDQIRAILTGYPGDECRLCHAGEYSDDEPCP